MLRRYPDGAVFFDPQDGLTYTLSTEALDVLDTLQAMAAEGLNTPDALFARIVEELTADGSPPDTVEAGNLQRWARLALRLNG